MLKSLHCKSSPSMRPNKTIEFILNLVLLACWGVRATFFKKRGYSLQARVKAELTLITPHGFLAGF